MLKIAVCDDNIQFAQILVEKIRTLCATTVSERIMCEIVTAFTTADSVVDYLKDNTIDLLFLDIEMPGRHGFSLAKELRQHRINEKMKSDLGRKSPKGRYHPPIPLPKAH